MRITAAQCNCPRLNLTNRQFLTLHVWCPGNKLNDRLWTLILMLTNARFFVVITILSLQVNCKLIDAPIQQVSEIHIVYYFLSSTLQKVRRKFLMHHLTFCYKIYICKSLNLNFMHLEMMRNIKESIFRQQCTLISWLKTIYISVVSL